MKDANNNATDDADNELIDFQDKAPVSDSESESDDEELVADDDETSSIEQLFNDTDSGDQMTLGSKGSKTAPSILQPISK